MLKASAVPLLVGTLALATSLPAPAQPDATAGEEQQLLLIADAPQVTPATRSWELALSPPTTRGLSFSGLRLGDVRDWAKPDLVTELPRVAPAPPQPSDRPDTGTIFATLSDNRLLLSDAGDGRRAGLSQPGGRSIDWSGYEARDRRAHDSLTDSMQTLEWPDLEGGSEPLVPSTTRTPDGKRSGLGLGWRF